MNEIGQTFPNMVAINLELTTSKHIGIQTFYNDEIDEFVK